MTNKIIIHWFRQDLRISDNPALNYANLQQGKIMPVYIIDNINYKNFDLGAASKVWLYHSLNNLNKNLDNKLNLYIGNPEDILTKLIKKYNAEHITCITCITWNRCYEPESITRDTKLKKYLKNKNIKTYSDNSLLLWEPWEINKKDHTNYKVFTAFYQRGCLQAHMPREPISRPKDLNSKLIKDNKYSIKLTDLNLLPKISWDKNLINNWTVGEEAAKNKLKKFLGSPILNYQDGRNIPSKQFTSKLSPHLHFGEISPNQIWYATQKLLKNNNSDNNIKIFLSELAWREFSYNLLFNYNNLPNKNWREQFDKFPWNKNINNKYYKLWTKGQTGYPIVDAGMRELWQTGYMHNRVRMITASFLVKNLLVDWRLGAKWFWDCLVDADLASNSASWQWVAGSGADSAPYFRIFNPVIQGEKFDPNGEYVKKYIPELSKLPAKYIHRPFDAPIDILTKAGIKLGKNYPKPIVDLSISRQKALDAYKSIK